MSFGIAKCAHSTHMHINFQHLMLILMHSVPMSTEVIARGWVLCQLLWTTGPIYKISYDDLMIILQ